GQIGQIVPHIAGLFGLQAALADHFVGDGELVLEALTDEADSQLAGPQLDDVRRAGCEHAEAKTGPLPELNSQAVADVKAFQLNALIVVPDAAVGQHAVHIGQYQLDAAAAVG